MESIGYAREGAMNMKTSTAWMLALPLLVMTAGCAKKKMDSDIPPPIGTEGGMDSGSTGADGAGGYGNAGGPGSQEDFIARVSSDRIYFALDRFDVDSEDRTILDSQAAWLRQYPNVRITIEGHCDERGTRDYNIALGERRANAAKNYLVSLGIDPGRITTVSYGKERPAAMGSNEQSWAQNRRAVTITVRP
jgi:peptidoglycan-associated lipoprotein